MHFSRLTSLTEFFPGGWLFKLAILRLLAQWRSILTIIVGVLLAAMTGASVSLYTNAVAQIGMVQRLEQRPVEDVHIHSRLALDAALGDAFAAVRQTLDETTSQVIDEQFARFPGWVGEVVAWSETTDVLVVRGGADLEGLRARIGYYEGIQDYVEVVEGVFPSGELPEDVDLQIALTPSAAEQLDVQVGDLITLDQRGWATSIPMQAQVSALITPLDENHAFWMSPAPLRIDTTRPDRTEINVISTRSSVEHMTANFMPQTRTQIGWRVLFDHSALVFDQLNEAVSVAETFEDQFIIALEAAFSGEAPSILVSSGLNEALSGYSGDFELLGAPFAILLLQLAALVIFFLLVMGALVRRSERREVAILQSRGAKNHQLLGMRGAEAIIICAVAVMIGVPLARAFLVAFMPLLVGIDRLVLEIHPDAYLYASVAAMIALVVLVLTMLPILNRPLVVASGVVERKAQPWWQRYYVDVLLLIIGLGALWRLVTTRSPTASQQTDPLLLLVPTLLFFALGSLSLRLFPMVMNTAASFFAHRGELQWTMAGWQVSREPVHYGRITLLLALAISIGWFGISFQNTVTDSTYDQAAYRVGTDIRATYSNISSADFMSAIQVVDGVEQVDSVLRMRDANMATSSDSLVLDTGQVLAVPETFDEFAFWRDDLGTFHIPLWNELLPQRGVELPQNTEQIGFWVYAEGYPSNSGFNPATEGVPTIPEFHPYILLNGTATFEFRVRDGDGTMHYVPVTFNGWPQYVIEMQGNSFGSIDEIPPPENLPDDGWIYGEVDLGALTGKDLSFEGIVISVRSSDQFISTFASGEIFTFRDAVGFANQEQIPFDWFNIDESQNWDFTSEVNALGGIQRDPLSVHFDSPNLQIGWSQRQTNGTSAILYHYPEITTTVVRDHFGAELVSASEAVGISAVVSRSFADANDFLLGQKFTLFLDNVTLWFEVAAVTDYYPTLYTNDQQFVVVPKEILLYTLQRRPSSQFYPNEAWIRLNADSDSGAVIEQLATLPDMPMLTGVESSEARMDSLQSDLLTSGLIGLLLLSFIVGLVLSIVSLVTYSALTVQARGAEFAVLRALGFTRWRLVLSVTAEQAFVVVIALILGVVMGIFLSAQVLPTLSISASGTLTPPYYVAFEAGTLVLYCLLILLALMIELVLSSMLISQMNIADATRLGGE